MADSPPLPGPLERGRRALSPEKAQALIERLEASTAHMRASGDRALLGVIASNDRRIAELHEDIALAEEARAGQQL